MVEALDKEGLSEENNLRERYEEKYKKLSKEHSRLGKIVHQDLEKLLEDANIEVLSVTHRTKDFDKYLEKIRRKKYNDPLNEIEDICGLRIVCYYTSDLDKIASIIKKEFNVLDSIDKSQLLGEDEFGYLSQHFVVKLKDGWLNTPSYRDLGHLKAEIQLRTVLMHAWADISHKLAYKKKEQAPSQFMRQLNSLSAILENADTQFNTLRNDRENYIEEISGKTLEHGTFDLNQKLNLDSLQAFLDFYFTDRKKDIDNTGVLLDEIMIYNKRGKGKITFKTILNAYNKYGDELETDDIVFSKTMKRKEIEKIKSNDMNKFKEIAKNNRYFNQIGATRRVLECVFKDYKKYKIEIWHVD